MIPGRKSPPMMEENRNRVLLCTISRRTLQFKIGFICMMMVQWEVYGLWDFFHQAFLKEVQDTIILMEIPGELLQHRLENATAGWPSYTMWGDNGETYTCHDYYLGTFLGTRVEKGTGTWNKVIQAGPPGVVDISFPRVMTTGINKQMIHILSCSLHTMARNMHFFMPEQIMAEPPGKWKINYLRN